MTDSERQNKIANLILSLTVVLLCLIAFYFGTAAGSRERAVEVKVEAPEIPTRFIVVWQPNDHLCTITDTKTGNEYLYKNGALIKLN